jgi:hypothetical protein
MMIIFLMLLSVRKTKGSPPHHSQVGSLYHRVTLRLNTLISNHHHYQNIQQHAEMPHKQNLYYYEISYTIDISMNKITAEIIA